jgi:hypothetical protein
MNAVDLFILDLSFYCMCVMIGITGTCLIKIARQCSQLQRVSLGYLGSALSTANTFMHLFRHFKNVTDIRPVVIHFNILFKH